MKSLFYFPDIVGLFAVVAFACSGSSLRAQSLSADGTMRRVTVTEQPPIILLLPAVVGLEAEQASISRGAAQKGRGFISRSGGNTLTDLTMNYTLMGIAIDGEDDSLSGQQSTIRTSILIRLLEVLCVWAVAWGIIIGAQSIFASLVISRLRRRFPTLSEQRTYLLKGPFYVHPEFNEEQRLEFIRGSRKNANGLSLIFPLWMLGELLCRWLGVMRFDHAALLIESAGVLTSIPMVFIAAFIVARANLAGDVLCQPPAATAASQA